MFGHHPHRLLVRHPLSSIATTNSPSARETPPGGSTQSEHPTPRYFIAARRTPHTARATPLEQNPHTVLARFVPSKNNKNNTKQHSSGYDTLVLDGGWSIQQPGNVQLLDENGLPVPDPTRFPHGMKALAAEVHSLGLKFGLWNIRGVYGWDPADYFGPPSTKGIVDPPPNPPRAAASRARGRPGPAYNREASPARRREGV